MKLKDINTNYQYYHTQVNSLLAAHFNFLECGANVSALEHCRKIKFSDYVHQTLVLCLSDFVRCRKRFCNQSRGSLSQA